MSEIEIPFFRVEKLYKNCQVKCVRFYKTEYYEKSLYTMRKEVLVENKVISLVYKIRKPNDIIGIAYAYKNGDMQRMNVCKCTAEFENEFLYETQKRSVHLKITQKCLLKVIAIPFGQKYIMMVKSIIMCMGILHLNKLNTYLKRIF